MPKEKFDRNREHVNISKVGKNYKDLSSNRKSMATAAFEYAMRCHTSYEQYVLNNLINEYGEIEGKRRFEIMKQNSKEKWEELQKIDFNLDDDAKSSGPKR